MEWVREVSVDEVRTRWPAVNMFFSPSAGWPPDLTGRVDSTNGQEIPLAFTAGGLALVASRVEYWDAQAIIVGFCSARGEAPSDRWPELARLEDGDRTDVGDFVVDKGIKTSHLALAAAGRLMMDLYSPLLDGLGAFVAGIATNCWEDCLGLAGDPWIECMKNCR